MTSRAVFSSTPSVSAVAEYPFDGRPSFDNVFGFV